MALTNNQLNKKTNLQPVNQYDQTLKAIPTAPNNNIPLNTTNTFQTTSAPPQIQTTQQQPQNYQATGLDNLRGMIEQIQSGQGQYRQDLYGNLNNYQNALYQNQQQMAQQAQKIAEQLQFATSPEAFQQILGQVMESYSPLVEQQKADITDQYGNMMTRQDEDSARRGLFNSGVAQQLVKDLEVDRERQISRALAEIQAMASQQAGDFQDRMITGVTTQGDWVRDDRQLNDESLRGMIDNYLQSEGLANDKEAQERSFILNSEQIFEQARQYEKSFAEDKRQYEKSFKEDKRQFNETLDQRKIEHADDMKNFAKQMKLDWAKFNASEKARATQARLQAQQANKQASNQAKKDNMETMLYAYDMISKAGSQSKAKNAIKAFEGVVSDKDYRDLEITARTSYKSPTGYIWDPTKPKSASNPGGYDPLKMSYGGFTGGTGSYSQYAKK